MKQIWPNYSYSPTTNVLTLTGLNIDRDQLLLVTAADRGRIMYNFADSSVTASAFTSGANTALTLVATTAGLTTTAALVIYYDDQLQSTSVTISNFPATQPVSIASVTIGNTVTIAGTVTANPTGTQTIAGTVTANLSNVAGTHLSGTIPSGAVRIGWGNEDTFVGAGLDANGQPLPIQIYLGNSGADIVTIENPLPISGTVTIGSALPTGTNRIGVVTIGAGTVTLGASTAQIGSVTASISGTVPVSGTFFQATQPVSLTSLPALVASTAQIGSVTASITGTVPVSGTFWQATQPASLASLPALAAGTAQIGSVTASISANPSGALTTRFGSVTTANTAQITTAVTNTSRKYLFAQNISVGSVTVGIGFSPTTTQGIQLSAGSGIVFDSFCPTGAVYWLGATTGAAWSILEG